MQIAKIHISLNAQEQIRAVIVQMYPSVRGGGWAGMSTFVTLQEIGQLATQAAVLLLRKLREKLSNKGDETGGGF